MRIKLSSRKEVGSVFSLTPPSHLLTSRNRILIITSNLKGDRYPNKSFVPVKERISTLFPFTTYKVGDENVLKNLAG